MKKYLIFLIPIILFCAYVIRGFLLMKEDVAYPPEYQVYIDEALEEIGGNYWFAVFKLRHIKVYPNNTDQDGYCKIYTANFHLYDIFGLPGGYRIVTKNCDDKYKSGSIQSGNYLGTALLFWTGILYTFGFLIYTIVILISKKDKFNIPSKAH